MPRRPSCSRHTGLTLLELMATLAVLGLLVAVAAPSFIETVSSLRADALRMQLNSAFSGARMAAVTRRENVSVCPSDDGRRCTAEWSKGWLTYRDPLRRPQPAAEQDILQYYPGQTALTLLAPTSAGRPRLRFRPDGSSMGINLTVTICARGRRHSRVIVNNAGRARSERLADRAPC
ncbi:prepilin-type N-terminal cleavage/methylation domain-containing protein [Stenotrophomonas sp. SAM-B]|jgi:type IV fimbrial biogenesis protein FimT|uniref:GspH/FimT family pseudopilin n=1 Tax=unclassified Stenotrophomonas TaxID=196198 RepID=UPI0015A122F4|nr:GspH/FimT family pseudopilin [Stenotrophomonas sp. SAM-B]NWF33421.1 prepilin-type N-terminal cleavage/methylation domain-containing protein [Stenotrophomonas sp. SAM-B]